MNSANSNNGNKRLQGYDSAWEEAAKEIAVRGLKGLTIKCPKCHEDGTIISKWKKKTTIKPLYVIHANDNGCFKACSLDEEQAVRVRNEIRVNSKDILKTLRMGKPFVLFSGGKDSLCTLEYMRRLGDRVGVKITALHANTTAGFPEVEKYVQDVCNCMKIPLVTVKSPHDFFDIAKRWGIPGFKSRWCCETLKIAPMRRFLAEVEDRKIIYDGIRAAESWVRAKYVPVWFHPSFRSISVSPLFNWSDNRINRYIARYNLPENPINSLGTSAECWCGAYKRKCDFETLLEIHSDIFEKLVEVETAQKGRYTFLYENGKQVPLSSLTETNKK